MRLIIAVFLIVTLAACVAKDTRPFNIKNLAKADIDLATDIHIQELRKLTKKLIVKLYKRNPRELNKYQGMTIEKRIVQLMTVNRPENGFAELDNSDSVAALSLAFSPDFGGDRVFALMAGITGMLNNAYNNQTEFFFLDEIDQQKLYYSARNLETISWKLNNLTYDNGEPLLLSNGRSQEGIANYSYERILSQMIIIQDMMALLIADRTNRTINKVVQGIASFVFIPI